MPKNTKRPPVPLTNRRPRYLVFRYGKWVATPDEHWYEVPVANSASLDRVKEVIANHIKALLYHGIEASEDQYVIYREDRSFTEVKLTE